jgi:hypothetical protein
MRIEVTTDYLPRLTEWHVRQALKWIDPVDVAGIDLIRLARKGPDEVNTSRQPVYLRGEFYPGDYVQINGHRPHINLYTNDLFTSIPSVLRLSPMATLRVAFVLAHEVGHHVIATRGYVYDSTERYQPPGVRDRRKERMADRYAQEALRKMLKNLYYRLGYLLSRKLSYINYELGMAAYTRGDYRRAAFYWFNAACNNPDDIEANSAYHKALKMLGDRK